MHVLSFAIIVLNINVYFLFVEVMYSVSLSQHLM